MRFPQTCERLKRHNHYDYLHHNERKSRFRFVKVHLLHISTTAVNYSTCKDVPLGSSTTSTCPDEVAVSWLCVPCTCPSEMCETETPQSSLRNMTSKNIYGQFWEMANTTWLQEDTCPFSFTFRLLPFLFAFGRSLVSVSLRLVDFCHATIIIDMSQNIIKEYKLYCVYCSGCGAEK